MPITEETWDRLAAIPELKVSRNVPLSRLTRLAIGGPAAVFAETASEAAFLSALERVRDARVPFLVIGDGTNLVASDNGFDGVVLRYTASAIRATGDRVVADAGALLQDIVDFTVAGGRRGIETLSGIPGSLGGAVYGNAGAYGHTISESVHGIRYWDGGRVRALDNSGCGFEYRESVFKSRKEWVILQVELTLSAGEAGELRRTADEILDVRNRKFPSSMKCAGSVFKNLRLDDLPAPVAGSIPEEAIREGKVAAAYFLAQVGAKGMSQGGIRVADYHANLIYNDGAGTAREFRNLIRELKSRVRRRFGFELEEEVQYVGFPPEDREEPPGQG